MSINELRLKGYRVRVTHFRFEQWLDRYSTIVLRHQGEIKDGIELMLPVRFWPFGGETHVEIICPDGSRLYGEAKCSMKDNYNKKLGVKIALGRALAGGSVAQWTERVVSTDEVPSSSLGGASIN